MRKTVSSMDSFYERKDAVFWKGIGLIDVTQPYRVSISVAVMSDFAKFGTIFYYPCTCIAFGEFRKKGFEII